MTPPAKSKFLSETPAAVQQRYSMRSKIFFLSLAATTLTLAAEPPTSERPLPTPGMGWSTYNFFISRHNEQLFHGTAEAFEKSGLRDAGYRFLRIDGGWWGDDSNRRHYYWTADGRYANGTAYRAGDPHVDPKNYPNGLKGLADHLHTRGFKLGFYHSPALSMGSSGNFPGNKEPSVPSPVQGFALVEQHAKFVAESGVDHLFYDGYDWNREKGIEPYTRMFSALRAAAKQAGRPIAVSINSGWSARAPEWADEWRTGRDINGEWPVILECMSTLADPAPAGSGRWNNPDYLMAGFCSDIEAQSQMSVWCIAAAPLYLSHDFRVMDAWERYVVLNTEAIAVDQDAAGKPGRRVRREGAVEVWARELHDGRRAVVLLNRGDAPAAGSVTFQEIGLAAETAQVRDLWEHRNLGAFTKSFRDDAIPPHGCRFITIARGDQPTPEPKPTWAPRPASKLSGTPLAGKGWTQRTTLPRKDDPLAALFDGDPKTGFWSYASPGQFIEMDFAEATTFDTVVLDLKGHGPHPWPQTAYAPRSAYRIEVSADGETFKSVAEETLGPKYGIARFKPVTARKLRIVLTATERTTTYGDDPTFHCREVYLFNSDAKQRE